MKAIGFYSLLIFFSLQNCFSQNEGDSLSILPSNIDKPSILALHPYGIFISRIQGQFNHQPVRKTRFKISVESANVWGAPVEAFIPLDESIRNEVRQYEYHRTEFIFDPENFEHEKISMANDGVIKGLKINSILPISSKSDLHLGFRSFLLTKGKVPFSLLTGDQFIEWFHKSIAGGDDPFARELFGLDEARIYYNDRNNNEMEINSGDVLMGGLEAAYYMYPTRLSNPERMLYSNFGVHIGANLSRYNSSIDLGLSYNITKSYQLSDLSLLRFGLGSGVLRKNVINLKNDNMDFGSNDFLGNLEALASYEFLSKKGIRHAISMDFYLQSSFNKKDEFEYSIPTRSGVSEKSWVTGFSHLYKNNNYWTLLYSFEKKVKTTFYIQQDLTLNNHPDIQTGINLSFNL